MYMHSTDTEQFIELFSRMFRYIDAYSAILTGAQLRRRGEASPAFFENGEKYLQKEGPYCYWVKFSIENIVLRVSRRKNLEMFPCGTSFSCVSGGMFIEAPQFTNSVPCPEKFMIVRLHSVILNTVFSVVCQHIQPYSVLLKHIHAF